MNQRRNRCRSRYSGW